jgi:hypothetical protein
MLAGGIGESDPAGEQLARGLDMNAGYRVLRGRWPREIGYQPDLAFFGDENRRDDVVRGL